MPFDIITARLLIRLLFGLILISDVSKLAQLRSFRRGIQEYQVFPSSLESKVALSTLLSFCIPVAEFVAGLGLASGILLVPATILALGLLTMFSGAIFINLIHGRYDLSCHCAGVLGSHQISWWLLGRNGIFIAGLSVLLMTPTDRMIFDLLVNNATTLNAVLLSTVLSVALIVGAILVAFLLLSYARVLRRP